MEVDSPTVDVHALFCHYNFLYFDDSLGACAVSWTSDPLPCGASDCDYYQGGCDILLSEHVFRTQSINCLKNVLLHEMIHAYMCIHHGNRDRSDHGQEFQLMMNSINSNIIHDVERPDGGYSIITSHEIPKEDVLGKGRSKHQDPTILEKKGFSSKDFELIKFSDDDGPSSSQSRNKNGKRIIEIEPEEHVLTYYYSKKPTENSSPNELKRRKLDKTKEYAVIIEWLDVFTDEESDGELVVPLVNKRSERRKQQMASVREAEACSQSFQENEIRTGNELKKDGTEDNLAIDESLIQNEQLAGISSAKCRNEVVEVSDG